MKVGGVCPCPAWPACRHSARPCRYFALIIRAISVLEGIALVGNEEFAIIDEAFPYIAQRLLTDDSPRLHESLRYMVYGRSNSLDVERLIDLLSALETFTINSKTASGNLSPPVPIPADVAALPAPLTGPARPPAGAAGLPQLPLLLPDVLAPLFAPLIGGPRFAGDAQGQPEGVLAWQSEATAINSEPQARSALQFMLSPEGSFFRSFLLDEIVASVDALSRTQMHELVKQLNLEDVLVPVWLPGATRAQMPLAVEVTEADRHQVESVAKLMNFLVGGSMRDALMRNPVQMEVLPLLPRVAQEVLPQIVFRLSSRVTARFIRYLYT
jgi:aarF domain-containing kinase